jgi:hypothetical protein
LVQSILAKDQEKRGRLSSCSAWLCDGGLHTRPAADVYLSSLTIGDEEPLGRTLKIDWRLTACSDRPSDYKNPLDLSCYTSFNPVIFHHLSKMDPIFRENNLPKQKWTKALEVHSDQGDAAYGPFTSFDLLDRESGCQSPTLSPLSDTLGPRLQGDTLRGVNSFRHGANLDREFDFVRERHRRFTAP